MSQRLLRLALALTVSALVGGSAAGKGTAPAASAPGAPAPAAPTPTVDELLAMFKRLPGVRAHFREEKHLALLEAPLVNEGTLAYAPPGRLVRHTERPVASTVLIDRGQLSFGAAGDPGSGQKLDLATNPVARAFVDSFLLLLAGDGAGLARTFTLEIRPWGPAKGRGWQLTLVPRDAPMNKILTSLTLHGRALDIADLDLRETSGDWSHTEFTNVDVTHAISPAEQTRLFRIPGR